MAGAQSRWRVAGDGLVEKFAGPQLEIRWRAPIGSGYSGPTVAEGRSSSPIASSSRSRSSVHCFDGQTGKKLWTHEYDCPYENVGYAAGPRACVTIDDGRAYSLGAMGHLFCFDAAKGKVLWSKDCNEEYKIRMPIWGIAASPLIEGPLVIVQIGGARGLPGRLRQEDAARSSGGPSTTTPRTPPRS